MVYWKMKKIKVEKIKKWYIEKEKIYFASIELTQNCNFQCKHCYCADKQSKNLSLNDYKKIIDKLADIGCLFLNFTGGEIFTYEHFKDVYIYAKNKGFIIDLLTNASLIDDELCKLFIELPPNSIAITVYGTNEKDYHNFTGSGNNFYKTMNGLTLLKNNKIHFVLRTVATKTLRGSLMKGEFEKLAERFDTSFKYEPIIFPKTTGNTTPLNECLKVEQIIELEKSNASRKAAWEIAIQEDKPFSWSCNAGVNSMAIDNRGNAYICGLYRNNPISVIDSDMGDVLQHLQHIHKVHIGIVENNECSHCDVRRICKWCPAYSYIYNHNDYQKVKFFCEISKARMNEFGFE